MRFLLLALGLIAQPGLEPFAGTWTAEFAGTRFVRLELTLNNGQLSGTLGIGNITVDKQGALERVEPIRNTFPIANVVARSSRLSFTQIDDGDGEPFELDLADGPRLVVVMTEELAAALKEEGIATLMPIALKKTPR